MPILLVYCVRLDLNWKESHSIKVQLGDCSLSRCVQKDQLHSEGSASANDSFNPLASQQPTLQSRHLRTAQTKYIWVKCNQNIQKRIQLQRTPKCVRAYLQQ